MVLDSQFAVVWGRALPPCFLLATPLPGVPGTHLAASPTHLLNLSGGLFSWTPAATVLTLP